MFKSNLKKALLITASLSSLFTLGYAASAATGSSYLFTGGFTQTDVSGLSYVKSGGDSAYQTNVMSGVDAWNGISTKVRVINSSTGAKVSVYKSTSTVSGLNGRMDPYYKNSFGGMTLDSAYTNVWAVADVFGFDNNMNNVSGIGSLSTSQRKAVFTHEMGHALSLKHNNSTYFLIMNQYTQDTVAALTPKTDDKGNLKLKWGN